MLATLLVRNKGPVQGFLPVSVKKLEKAVENEDSENHVNLDGCEIKQCSYKLEMLSAATLCIFWVCIFSLLIFSPILLYKLVFS